ncbi:MAG: hypothetical protein AB8I08_15455 [Sandaracinaceae bacterium]
MSRSALRTLIATVSALALPSMVSAVGLAGLQACGGSQSEEEDPPPVCYLTHEVPDGGMMRNLNAEEWADLVVRGYRSGGQSSQNCVGDTIQWRRTDRACDVHEDDDERPPTPVEVSEENVIVGRGDTAARRPVWVITHEFEDGDGFGPVAVTQRTEMGVSVTAIGSLRMPRDRARLRLRTTGGQEIVVADGERCPPEEEEEMGDDEEAPNPDEEGNEEQPPTCLRYARLMPVVGDQVMSPELRNREGHCMGPAQVFLSREQTIVLETGWERTFRLAASMEYRGGGVIVHEQVTAEDADPRDPGRPARLFRTTDVDRVIMVQERGGMRSSNVPLFERSVRAGGSTQLPLNEAEL